MFGARARPLASPLALLMLVLSVLPACGGSGRPDPISGPYALVSAGGAPGQLLELSSGYKISCNPQTTIKQYDYEAASEPGASSGKYMRFSLKDYDGPKAYSITYGETLQPHTVEVGVDGYAYQFDSSKRDGAQVGSSCTITLDSERSGTVTCLMLFAVRGSSDYVDPKEGVLQGFADLYARFECQ